MPEIAIVIPLKAFTMAKQRLRTHGMNVDGLTATLAAEVIAASAPRDTYVVSESAEPLAFASHHGALPILSPHSGLNNVVTFAYETLRADYDYVVFAHGDLAQPDGLGTFVPSPGLTIVTDQHGTGTLVLALETAAAFSFHFGAASRALHCAEARRRGIPLHEITDSPWCSDIDDLQDYLRWASKTRGPEGPLV